MKPSGLSWRSSALLGLACDASAIPKTFWEGDARRWYLSPGSVSHARHHGDFDNDQATLRSTLKRIVETVSIRPALEVTSARMVRSRDARSQYRQKLGVALRR